MLEAEKDSKAGGLEDDGAWNLIKSDLSWEIWRLWRSFRFEVELWPGGILNYPDWFIKDAQVFNWLEALLKEQTGL